MTSEAEDLDFISGDRDDFDNEEEVELGPDDSILDQLDDEEPEPKGKSEEEGEGEGEREGNEPVTVKLNYGDKEVEVQVPEGLTPEEFKTGMLTAQDYQSKMREVTELEQSLGQQGEMLQSSLDLVATKLLSDMDKLNKSGLKEEDPEAYYAQRSEIEKTTQELKSVQQTYIKQQRQAQENLIRKSIEQIPQYIPEWIDRSVMEKEAQEMTDHFTKQGFTDEELASVHDPRVLSALRKAYKYDKAVERKEAIKKKNNKSGVKRNKSEPSRSQKNPGGSVKSDEDLFFTNM